MREYFYKVDSWFKYRVIDVDILAKVIVPGFPRWLRNLA